MNFADRLVSAIRSKGNPCVVGLDPRIGVMPRFVTEEYKDQPIDTAIRRIITGFHALIIESVSGLVPAVKLQIAFYEQYGVPGLQALMDTIGIAKQNGLIVIIDAKRNDIASTAEAYANAFLGRTEVFGKRITAFDADCITVSPFLGRDSLMPFVRNCIDYEKGMFVLVKTSNVGSADLQDQRVGGDGEPIYRLLAGMVDELSIECVGDCGYSSIGAVVGATFPQEARELRRLMPHSFILVPGYGAQGGTAEDAAACFNRDGSGAVVNASRSITHMEDEPPRSRIEFMAAVRQRVLRMAADLQRVVGHRE